MTFIVQNDENKLYNAKNISEKLSIPYKYLTRIMTQLVESNLIKSIRGREGGYSMIQKPSEIKIIDILTAVKECLHGTDCLLGTGLCDNDKKCALHDRWKNPRKSMIDMFQNTTLEDLNKEVT